MVEDVKHELLIKPFKTFKTKFYCCKKNSESNRYKIANEPLMANGHLSQIYMAFRENLELKLLGEFEFVK